MPNNEVQATIQDVLIAINTFSDNVEARFSAIDEKFYLVEQRFSAVDGRLATIEQKFVTKDDLQHVLAAMETRLVSKEYLDEKLFDLRGDLVLMSRKTDQKSISIVNLLQKKKIFSTSEAQSILN